MLRTLGTLFGARFSYDRCPQDHELLSPTFRRSAAYAHPVLLIFVALGSAAVGALLSSMLNSGHQPTYSNRNSIAHKWSCKTLTQG